MAGNVEFLYFGDYSQDIYEFLTDLCCRGNLGLLAGSFLDQVASALKIEVNQVSTTQRQSIPLFSTIKELNEKYYMADVKNSAIDNALLCITQLAHYIDYTEKFSHDPNKLSETCIIGESNGLFAAAAIASSQSLSELVPVSVQLVLIAFRSGLCVAAMASRISNDAKSRNNWAYDLPNTTQETVTSVLNDFHKEKSISPASRVYISAIWPNSITISGPPITLKQLFSSGVFSVIPTPVPIHGPYHAAHLYSIMDIVKILHFTDAEVSKFLQNSKPRFPVMSSAAGTWYSGQNAYLLIHAIIQDILTEPLQFSKMLHGCLLKGREHRSLVMPFGPICRAQSLAAMLKAESEFDVILTPPSSSREKSSDSLVNSNHAKPSKLAIVGMSGRFPGAASHGELWKLLEKGLDVHREVPGDRFDVKTHTDVTGKTRNTGHTPYGCWIDDPGLFDPRFFNMSPREALQTDPMQRLALVTAYEALEMAGYVANRTPSTRLDRIGTFYGQTSDDWREINAAQDIDTYFITGGVRAFGPGRINYHFGFSGPSFSIDTACSSSAAAIQLACTSLLSRDCDTAIVGGLSCMTNPDIFAGLSRGQFLSKKGPCATFDDGADGYCRADGIGTVIIKRLDDALADKDNVLALILGSATNHSADAISITHPHGGTQEVLYRNILDKAGVDPLDVDYVEMHGTGTQAGDHTEMQSVTNVFAPPNRKRGPENPLFLGSVKANIGHGEAASGVTSLIKALLMLRNKSIPPHVGIKNTINKGFPKDLGDRNVHIAFHNTSLRRKTGRPLRIFVNNFSAAGGNTGLLLEEAPIQACITSDPRSTHIVTVTAKSKSALIKNAERLIEYLAQNPTISVADLAYTTTARRMQYNWRIAVPAADVAQVRKSIQSKLLENLVPILSEKPKVIFVFTGQGSHYAAMGKDLYENSSVFRENIVEFDRIASIHGFPSFIPLIDGGATDIETLSSIAVQIGIVCLEIALARLWESWGIKPSIVLGHSLGEYAALCISGVLSVSDTIYLTGTRAQLLVEKCPADTHSMLAVQGPTSSITETLKSVPFPVNIACINSTREIVLSGKSDEMSNVANRLRQSGFKCTQLQVPFAFHSEQIDPILAQFEELAESVDFRKADIPIISSAVGRYLDEPGAINASYLSKHARNTVNFVGGLVSAQMTGAIDPQTIFLEIGPHPVCLGMVKTTLSSATICLPTLRRNESAYKTISNSLSVLHTFGLKIDWNEYHRDFVDSLQLLSLPSYSFDEKNYWIQYEGDWCLTKGQPLKHQSELILENKRHKLSTTTVHTITKEEIDGNIVTLSTESDLSKQGLREVVTGHVVNGAMLCPSSLYADMAMTVCNYAYKLIKPEVSDISVDIANMKVPKPLLANADGSSQVLKLTVTLNAQAGTADLIFSTKPGTEEVEHATCRVFFGSCEEYLSEWRRNTYLIQSRIDWLKDAEKCGKAHKIGRGLAYKLFSALVDYDSKYRGMEEVILHSSNMEATSQVVFQTTEKDGNFMCSPYWIDSVAHISGFIVNASDTIDSRKDVYISHGWESLRIAEPFSADKTYRSYVKMQAEDNNVMSGDVFVFDGNKIIAVVKGLKFQCVPRKVLNMLLPMSDLKMTGNPGSRGKSSQTQKADAVQTPKVTMEHINKLDLNSPSLCSQALEILAAEVGTGIDELVDDIHFADLGIDSLMSLAVSGRMREELEIDIHSSDFNTITTIGSFKSFLAKFEKQKLDSTHNDSPTASLDQSTSNLLEDSNITTPIDDFSDQIEEDYISNIIRVAILEETGLDSDEIKETVDLATLGVDSLTSLSLLENLQGKTNMLLPGDFLIENLSIRDIKQSLKLMTLERVPKAMSTPIHTETVGIPSPPQRLASSVLLQGHLRKSSKYLWFIPDGGGSATSYVDIPNLLPDLAVLGLNSPYMKTPEEYKCGVVGIATAFITEIKRRQPHGPYLLAGWSAGGVIAFEVVNQLTKHDENVEKLILIDSPCPDIIEPLPSSLHAWFASIGLLGDGDPTKIPPWLLPHFAASVNALSNYTAEKIDHQKCPHVTAIWCEDGVCKLPTDPRPEPFPYGHAQFLLDNRTDFGPNLWDKYLDPKKLVSKRVPGNHFTMMKRPHVSNHVQRLIVYEAQDTNC
ncbi:hypothetical protein F5884DRAFT_679320 [Xylogone sp. PMI_703]|nr:hypothetical protein F5884DRAFT_679320 [Xylogone sp. PMI_703]